MPKDLCHILHSTAKIVVLGSTADGPEALDSAPQYKDHLTLKTTLPAAKMLSLHANQG